MAFWILYCFLGVLVLAAFCTSLLYWYERQNAPCPELSPPVGSIWHCLRLYCQILGGYLLGLGTFPCVWLTHKTRHSPLQPEIDVLNPPLLLIHGIYHNSSAWLFFSHALQRKNYQVSTFGYRSFATTYDEVLARLDTAIHLLEASYPGSKPVLIGHSMGGVLIRSWLGSNAANQHRIAGVITIGTPHQGSRLAPLAFGPLAREITPSSARIIALASESVAPAIPCTSLVSPTDELVLPSAFLLPPVGWSLRVTSPSSHLGMLMRPCVFKLLLVELQRIVQSKKDDISS